MTNPDPYRALADEIIAEFKKHGDHRAFPEILTLRLRIFGHAERHGGFKEGFAASSKLADAAFEALSQPQRGKTVR